MSAVANAYAWGLPQYSCPMILVSSDGSHTTVKVQWSVPIFVHF